MMIGFQFRFLVFIEAKAGTNKMEKQESGGIRFLRFPLKFIHD